MEGYKGTDKDLKCKNFQFEIGKTYKEKEAILCEKGFHFCEYPLDVLVYYYPNNSRYFELEAEEISEERKGNSKRVAKKITLKAEIGFSRLIKAGIEFIFSKVKWSDENNTTGDYSGASATGDYSGASATGNCSGASATGYKSGASATGDYSGASATGDYSGASATGNRSGASATGDKSGASATGNCSGASATGYKSGASATGDYSGASATGNRSGASATGNCSGASATGYKSGASSTGDYSGASATGDYSGASATGNRSGASATGNCSGASATGYKSGASAGKGSVALATGMLSRAKGDIGSFIILTECKEIDNQYFIKDVKVAKVDGKSVKENTWYFLKDGEFTEANDSDY